MAKKLFENMKVAEAKIQAKVILSKDLPKIEINGQTITLNSPSKCQGHFSESNQEKTSVTQNIKSEALYKKDENDTKLIIAQ